MRRSKLTAAEAAAFAAATAEELKRTSEESGSMASSMALSPRTGVMVTRDPLMSLVAQLRPLIRLLVFPLADEFALGRLNGSEAHAPVVRVLLNATATGARQNGRFPQGGSFPNGAIVFKEVRPSATGAPTLYVVMVKDRDNARAGNGWLWAEYTPSETTVFSVDRRGSAYISCHQRDGGTVRDLVRTFERQP